MIVRVRLGPDRRGAAAVPGVVAAVMAEVAEGGIDPAGTRVAADFVQYRHNFQERVARRVICGGRLVLGEHASAAGAGA